MNSKPHITIVGAGLVGLVFGIYMLKNGFRVSIFERRKDPRKTSITSGRSINLALSTRGLKALSELGLSEEVERLLIPMAGRMIHELGQDQKLQPYGKEGQVINSVSRIELNKLLLQKAEEFGAELHFDSHCVEVNLDETSLLFEHPINGKNRVFSNIIVGADGAFSAIRSTMERKEGFKTDRFFIEHGYKELTMPPKNKDFAVDPNALHIWPRNRFMLIALPNLDKSFTCTLFLPFKGPDSFEEIDKSKDPNSFFQKYFPDALDCIPEIEKQFDDHPTSSLVTIKSYPWVYKNVVLLGDAAHAIVPFYGQGMNCGFEDCRVFNEILNEQDLDWTSTMDIYQQIRKNDTDAISTLALNNFIEMRDKVSNEDFILQKKIEALIQSQYPERWIPLYSMVTFRPDISYSEALHRGKVQSEIMQTVLNQPDIQTKWEDMDYSRFVEQLPWS